MTSEPDVLVIGAGPAGSVTARLLAAWGHHVVLVDRSGSHSSRLAESIPPSADKILREVDVLGAVRAADFLPWRGNTVWWAEEAGRVETFGTGAGYQVLRRDFDRLLRAKAAEAGVQIEEGRVVEVRRAQTGDDLSTFAIDRAGIITILHARFAIDASGRAGVMARDGLRILDPARRTVAIAGTWEHSQRWPIADHTHTLIASYSDGWAWSVPLSERTRQFTVMVDPSRSDLIRDSSSREVYLAELEKVTPFSGVLTQARLVDGPWGADASEYTAHRYAGPGFLLAGDAASAINPLSSFGVKKALASGWLAAITAHTALVNRAMADEALAFFDRRERAVAAAAARQASQYAREAAARTGHPFWLSRATANDPLGEEGEPDPIQLAKDPDVQAAFADLRGRHAVRLRPGPDVRIEPKAAVRGREIVREEHLVTARWPEGVRYLRGVDLVQVVRTASSHHDVGAFFESSRQTTPGIALPDFLGALSVLVADGNLAFDSIGARER